MVLDGNLPFALAIIKKNRSLVNLGDRYGKTPLFDACCSDYRGTETSASSLAIVSGLIDEKADVNIATTAPSAHMIPRGATPLWAALTRAQSPVMAAFLMERGAGLHPDIKLSETSARVYELAKKHLQENRRTRQFSVYK